MVAVLDEDRVGVPILFLPGQESAALKDENTLSTRSEALCESATAGPGPDDDYIVMICVHGYSFGFARIFVRSMQLTTKRVQPDGDVRPMSRLL
jgi:hypothetical protein